MEAVLLEDIYSNGKGNMQYGAKGDRVSIVSVRTDVLIVKKGLNCFSVRIEKVKIVGK